MKSKVKENIQMLSQEDSKKIKGKNGGTRHEDHVGHKVVVK